MATTVRTTARVVLGGFLVVAQYVDGVDAFGLDTDTARAVRLLAQPVLVVWALWSTRGRAVTGPVSTRAPGRGGSPCP